MKSLGYFPAVLEELDNALTASRDPTRFLKLVEEALRKIASGAITYSGYPRTTCKRCILKKIPYSIIYEETVDEIRVVAFPHHRRRPGYWKKRLRPN